MHDLTAHIGIKTGDLLGKDDDVIFIHVSHPRLIAVQPLQTDFYMRYFSST